MTVRPPIHIMRPPKAPKSISALQGASTRPKPVSLRKAPWEKDEETADE